MSVVVRDDCLATKATVVRRPLLYARCVGCRSAAVCAGYWSTAIDVATSRYAIVIAVFLVQAVVTSSQRSVGHRGGPVCRGRRLRNMITPTAVSVLPVRLPLLFMMVVAITWPGTRNPPLQHTKSNARGSIDRTRMARTLFYSTGSPFILHMVHSERKKKKKKFTLIVLFYIHKREILFPGTGCPLPVARLHCASICFANFRTRTASIDDKLRYVRLHRWATMDPSRAPLTTPMRIRKKA